MHVAVSGWLLGHPSGANRRLLALAAHIAPLLTPDERLTVLHPPAFTPPSIDGVQWAPINIAPVPTRRRVREERRRLAAALRELRATVLDHGLLPLPRVDVPTCLLLHDLRAVDGLSRWPRWLARSVVRRSCAAASAVVVPSSFTATRLRDIVPDCTPTVIANGTVVPVAQPMVPPHGNGYLLHTGHLEARKNLAVVIEALARIPAAQRPDLVLVGRDAGSERALRDLARHLQLADRVQFLGVVEDDELRRLTANARGIVVPSTYEGFGLAALDGLAYGRPTLVADAGALPEVVGDAGAVLPAGDAAAWAAAMLATAEDDDDAIDRRRDRARRFSWSDAAAQTVALWRRVAGSPFVSAPAP